jgi:hypothetical protein
MRPPLPPTSSPNIHGQYSPMPLNRLPGPGRHSFDGERSSRKSNGGGDYDYGGGEYMHNSGPPKRRNSNSGSGREI